MTTAIGPSGEGVAVPVRMTLRDHRRYVWLGLGASAWLFSVGGRWDLPLAAWLFTVLLLRFSRTSRVGQAIGLVWLTSVLAVLFWAWESAVPMNLITTAACIAYGSVYAAPFVLDRLLAPRLGIVGKLLLYPAAHTACEFLMASFSPQGASYGLLAMTQHANLPLLQVISITGRYGIGFLISAFATIANGVWERSWREMRVVVGGYVFLIVAVIAGGEARLAFVPPPAEFVTVAGISPSTEVLAQAEHLLGHPVGAKGDPAHTDLTKEPAALSLITTELFGNTRRAAQAGAKIVVWSENAAVLPVGGDAAFLAQAAALAREQHIYLDVADNIPLVHDQTRLIGPKGELLWTYRKAHPIPGLEAYTPGNGKVPSLQTPFGRVANVICYDADFPAMMRASTDIILVPGGDWPEMGRVHTLKMASLRAIENGYALFRQDFNGLSAAFDRQGHVLAMQDTTTAGQHIMFADLPTRGSATIYRRLGDVFAWACVLAMLALSGMALVGRRAPPIAKPE